MGAPYRKARKVRRKRGTGRIAKMRKSKAETAETRKRIIQIAAKAFKSNGIHATGVSEIMAAAGMTHGGFYRHFSSKEELLAAACATNIEQLTDSFESAIGDGDDAFLKHLEDFLSAEYRDDRLAGCALVAMGSELVRADPETRRAASQGFADLIMVLTRRMGPDGDPEARDAAIFTLTSMIGAVTMARVIDDPGLSLRILGVAKRRLAGPYKKLQGEKQHEAREQQIGATAPLQREKEASC